MVDSSMRLIGPSEPASKCCGLLRHRFFYGLLAACLFQATGEGKEQLAPGIPQAPAVKSLSRELSTRGWILFSAKTAKGDYDLFLARPNGKQVRNITNTPGFNELGAQFWAGGKRILYRRLGPMDPKEDYRYLIFGTLVSANADGTCPVEIGRNGEYPWATLSPDGKQVACLYKKEGKIRILDFPSGQLVKEMPRHGIFSQVDWSPDGTSLCGTANIAGRDWNIVILDFPTGRTKTISRVLNCTPDWFPDSQGCIYSHRNPGLSSDDGGETAKRTGQNVNAGWTMIVRSDPRTLKQELLVAEQYRHLYFACVSPHGKHMIYCRPERDGSLTGPMAVIRLSDTPIVDGPWKAVESQYAPKAARGPILHLDLPPAFDPDWTYAEIGEK